MKKINSVKMTDEKKNTEQRIFEAACRVFQKHGYGGARMQDIADEADINKSMLHYYYRTKDQLFQKVYQQKMGRILPVMFELWNADLPLDEKIEKMVDNFYSFLEANPRSPHFFVHEMNENPERFRKFIESLELDPHRKFDRQLKHEAELGNIANTDPQQLPVSIVALILFPFIARTMGKSVSGMNDAQYDQFLEERKAFLVDFILNGINYKK
jgi:AcrR family transcriptional regulator